jgi:hypothetical protein
MAFVSGPANHNEQQGTRYQYDLNQRRPLLDKHISYIYYPFRKNGPEAGSPLGLLFYKLREGLSGRVLPLHHHRHRTHVSFTTVLGMDVLQHCMSRQRSLVRNASVKVLDPICVRAGKTDQRHPIIVLTNAVHN